MIINSNFNVAWWCRNRHLQTLYPTFFRKPLTLKLYDEILELPDGDFLELSWTEEKPSSPIVILLHGLEGSINSPYAKGILKTIYDMGWQGVLMHFRGCGTQHNRLDRSYHSGETGDLNTFITILKSRFQDQPIAAIGVSLGGNVLLKYLGEKKENSNLFAAMAISVPFDLADGARQLGTGLSKTYQKHLIDHLRYKMKDKFKGKAAPIDMDKIDEWRDFFSFDDNVTALIHGFKDVNDYYTQSSSKQFLKYITTPTLILHSKDDPFMTQESIPTKKELSPDITLELTEHGGHVGFIYGKPLKEKYWLEKRLVDFFTDKFNK